jgi:hypothetical protein
MLTTNKYYFQMKTSNKIILTFFLTALLIMTAVYATIYTKYKRGEYILFEQVKLFNEYALPPVKYVSITGLGWCHIQFGTGSTLRIGKGRATPVAYKVVNDTLVITGDSLLTKQDYVKARRNYQQVTLFITGKEVVNAFESDLYMKGAPDAASAGSLTVNLYSHSGLTTGDDDEVKNYYDSVQITANQSSVKFSQSSVINNLSIQSSASRIVNEKALIGQLQLAIDSSSTIMLLGKNLKDSKIISKE